MNNDIDKLRESELTDHLKKEEQELSLVDHLREVTEEKKELERQLEEVREFEKEIGRKLIINKIGALSDKELILSLRDYFGEQLKEKGDE